MAATRTLLSTCSSLWRVRNVVSQGKYELYLISQEIYISVIKEKCLQIEVLVTSYNELFKLHIILK